MMGKDRDGGRGPGGRRGARGSALRAGRAWIRAAVALAGLALPVADHAARAQQPEAPPHAAPAAGSEMDLSIRYRFYERYGLIEDLERPDQLLQYKVGTIQKVHREVEQARGAPESLDITYHTIYTERPARLGRFGDVTDTIRRYDWFGIEGMTQADPRSALLLKGLTIWYRPRLGAAPFLVSLTPDRLIRQNEYDQVRGEIFTPYLIAILPPRPVLIDDRWKIGRQAARVLLGKIAEGGNYRFEGTLSKVEKAGAGTAMTATIDLSGEMDFEEGSGAVRASLTFLFEPIRAAAATPKGASAPTAKTEPPRPSGLIEARGYFTKVLMGLRTSVPLDQQGRLQMIETGQIQLKRERVPVDTGAISVPEKPPTPDETNSWLLFDDSQRRFHLRHRQDLVVDVDEPDALVLHSSNPEGKSDTMIIGDVPKEADPVADRQWTDPQAFVRYIQQSLERRGFEVINGPMGWLPDADWAPKRKVYRYESALKQKDGSRMYVDAYLVLFSRGDHFVIQALTNREDHLAFRDQAEKLIKSLDLGPSSASPAGAGPRPAPPAATAPTPGTPPPAATAPTPGTPAPATTAPSRGTPPPPAVPRREERP